MNPNEENNQINNIQQNIEINQSVNESKPKGNIKIIIAIIIIIVIIALAIVLLMINKNKDNKIVPSKNVVEKDTDSKSENNRIPITLGYEKDGKNTKLIRTKIPNERFTHLFRNSSSQTCYIQEDGSCVINGKELDDIDDLIKQEVYYPSTVISESIEIEVVPTIERTLNDFKTQFPGGVDISDKAYSVITKFRYDNDRVLFYQVNSEYLIFYITFESNLSAKEYGEEIIKTFE